MRKFMSAIAIVVAVGGLAVAAWRRNPRIGTRFVNSVVNPALVSRGLVGRGPSELGTIHHVGRRSGIHRATPVHPEPTQDGFRILVPLGMQSEWVRNVLAAGGCRLELHDRVYELDEPAMVPAGEAADLPTPIRRLMQALGFQYLRLHVFTTGLVTLPTGSTDDEVPVEVPAAAEDVAREAVLAG